MKNILIILFLLISSSSFSQGKEEAWSRHAGGSWMDHGKAIASDASGSVYVTGGFQSVAKFGTASLSSNGGSDIFLARYAANGTLMWVVQAGSDTIPDRSLAEFGSSIVVDKEAIYLAGSFSSKSRFGKETLQSAGSSDIFLAKYSLDGKLLWVKGMGGKGHDSPSALALDGAGNIYMTGYTQKTARFGRLEITSRDVAAMFVARFDQNGIITWIKQSHSNHPNQGKAIQCGGGFCVVAGEFDQAIDLSGLTLQSQAKAVFIALYDLNGNVLGATELSGDSDVTAEDLLFANGNIFLAGSFTNTIRHTSFSAASNGNFDMYLAKLDNALDVKFIQGIGGNSVEQGRSMAMLPNQVLVLGGNVFGTLKIDGRTFAGNGGEDMALFYYTSDGTFIDGEVYGGAGQDHLNKITRADRGIALTGFFHNQVSVGDSTVTSGGMSDIMLARVHAPSLASGEKDAMSLYPNPCRNNFTIQVPETISGIKIYNMLGVEEINKFKADLSTNNVVLEGVASGIYVVKITAGLKSYESKLVVDR